jgi:hypothetical protein
MKTSYESVIINASFVGAKSRKAMYLVNPRNQFGTTIYKNVWIPTSWVDKSSNERHVIQWQDVSQEYVELPMREVTPGMLVETLSTHNGGDSLVGSRMVDGKVQQYVELNQRIEIAVPKWAMRNFKRKYTKVVRDESAQSDLFENEYSHYNIIDNVAKTSHEQHVLQERPLAEWFTSEGGAEPAIDQWLIDNPEYANDLSVR